MSTSDFSANTYILAWQFILITKAIEAMQPKLYLSWFPDLLIFLHTLFYAPLVLIIFGFSV